METSAAWMWSTPTMLSPPCQFHEVRAATWPMLAMYNSDPLFSALGRLQEVRCGKRAR